MPISRSLDQTEGGKQKLPSGINTLTILTYIGCVFGLIFTACLPMFYKFSIEMMDKATTNEDISATELADIEHGRTAIESAQENIVPIMIIYFIGIFLCVLGAIWMRKLKKDGYWLYVAGEILPVIGGLIILGTSQFTNVLSVLLPVGIPLIFITLYTMQRKFLAN
ncbi:MAG: hypothetical protein ABIN67_13085 [Ferruginibacter sp.]